MSFVPKSYVDGVGPDVSAAWLNQLDQLANNALQSAITVPQLQTILGISSPIFLPLALNQGGTGQTTSAAALAALGGTTLTAVENFYYPLVAPVENSVTLNLAYPFLHPKRYGVVGDGVTDDTAAMAVWVGVVNATTNPVSNWSSGMTVFCTNLPAITAANFVLIAYGATIKSKPITFVSTQLICQGVNTRIYGLTLDGNQAAFASSFCNALLMTANNPALTDVTIKNSSATGLIIDSISTTNTTITGLSINNLNITNCAATGYQFNNCAYGDIHNMVVQNNGWGFNAGFTQPGGSFGGTTRFRSHHLTFVDCSSMRNGLDGDNVNQGSYAIKHSACLAWMNGDGGFTIAGDNTTGSDGPRPGQGEPCWDLEYVDCEAYNNWAGGLVGETTVYNLTVLGGRYYNNGRACGTTVVKSVPNGIYMAAQGSLGLVIKAKCYDDRQLCPVTANSAGHVTATNWGLGTIAGGGPGATFVPTMAYYPRVAFYDATMTFQGYGTITAESSGSVTVVTTSVNGVNVNSIAAGWFVSQRVQHNGCFIDIGNQAIVDIDGFGNLPGPAAYFGFKVVSQFANPGQNVRNVNPELISSPELLSNPSFDAGIGSGTSWTYAFPGGGSATAYSTPPAKLYSPAGLTMTAGASNGTATAILIANGGNYLVDCWFEASCIIWAQNAGDAGILVNYGGGPYTTQIFHPGGGTRRLVIGGYLAGANTVSLVLFVSTLKTAWFDEASLKVKHEPSDGRDAIYVTRNLPF